MCGVFGVLSLDAHPLGDVCDPLERMGAALHHRGPDGTRVLTSPVLALGATRLRIIDLRACADQPLTGPAGVDSALMRYASQAPGAAPGTFWLACNGEIYNSAELRRRFPAYPYGSRSDLEPLLPLLSTRGAAGLAEVDGMFALAAWDVRRQCLILARDRAGEKPLFVAEVEGKLWFSSEIAALLTVPNIGREIDTFALSQYLKLGYVLEPRTLFAAIRRVESGTALIVRQGELAVHRYWDPGSLAPAGSTPPAANPRDRIVQLTGLIEAAVRRQVVADVPVGVFTSGGLDSSLVAALTARELAPRRVTTFSARFTADSYDETPWARRCARLAGTQHVEVPCTDHELTVAFRELTERSAEPISDPAVMPTWLLARAARQEVRVVLLGEGADELFGGYPTYLGHRLAPAYGVLPATVRRLLEQGIAQLPQSGRKVTLEFLLRRFVAAAPLEWVERHLAWLGAGLLEAHPQEHTDGWLLSWLASYRHRDPLEGALLLDYCTMLREKLLVKSDRALMLNSIEGRMPFLDRALTAFALGLPPGDKLHGLTTKWILKQAAASWLPRTLTHRRKRGLSVPIAGMINAALREDVDRLLGSSNPDEPELFDAVHVRRLLAEHRAGTANHARVLWPALVLKAWAERWHPVIPPGEVRAARATADLDAPAAR
jgi:asparagine synthase (glutamine-hydrolysing)